METCRPLKPEMLENPIRVRVNDPELDYPGAKKIADLKAKERGHDPMLLAWYDRKPGRFSPNVECCGEEKPAWMIYAESRGGDITISVNDETFVFIYRDLP